MRGKLILEGSSLDMISIYPWLLLSSFKENDYAK